MDDWMHACDSNGIVSLADLRVAGLRAQEVARMRSGEPCLGDCSGPRRSPRRWPWCGTGSRRLRISSGPVTAVVDFLLEEAPVAIEFDGHVKYGRAADEADPFGRRRPATQVLWEEKRREDWVREQDYEMVRVVMSDLDHPPELDRRIRRAVDRARARRRSA